MSGLHQTTKNNNKKLIIIGITGIWITVIKVGIDIEGNLGSL